MGRDPFAELPEEVISKPTAIAASELLPPKLAIRFTVSQIAVLGIISLEALARQDGLCTLSYEKIASRSGCSVTTVKAAIRRAKELRMVTVQGRQQEGLSNLIRIVSPEWLAWQKREMRS
jgi:Helix-turn-helix domain